MAGAKAHNMSHLASRAVRLGASARCSVACAGLSAAAAPRLALRRGVQTDAKEKAKQAAINTAKSYAENTEAAQRAKRAAGSINRKVAGATALMLLALGAATIFKGSVEAEELRKSGDDKRTKGQGPLFTKEQVSLLCLIGVPQSGKSTHAKRLQERWPEFEVLSDVKSAQDLHDRISKDKSKGKSKGGMRSYIVDGYPRSMADVDATESELVPAFCCLFFDLPEETARERFGAQSEAVRKWKDAREKLEPVVKRYRHEGNICEISADWDSADEVWEQVEAKTEQILELRERGDL